MIGSSPRPAVVPDLSAAIEPILRERLGRFGLERVEVRGRLGHASEPAIFADAWHRPVDEPIDREALARARLNLSDLLIDYGGERFAYLRTHFDEKRRVVGFG